MLVALVVGACSPGGPPSPTAGPEATPAATATATQTPPAATATRAPTPAPTPTPPPTVAPIGRVAPIAIAAVISGDAPAKVLRGQQAQFTVAGFRPLERVTVQLISPGAAAGQPLVRRADEGGAIAWDWDTTQKDAGLWTVRLQGSAGTARSFTIDLAEAGLPITETISKGTTFMLYRTPEAHVYSYPVIARAALALIAQQYNEALATIQNDLAYTLRDRLDMYLVPDTDSLIKEVEAAGAGHIGGLEAGIALYGFPRSGIYIDLSGAPAETMPHVVAHELTHQFTARIEGSGSAPVWFVEGLCEYEGYKAALPQAGDAERHWRRAVRATARRAVQEQRWIDLAAIGDYPSWQQEASAARLEQMYAQAYVTVDYIARAYGEAVLRPLLERLAAAPGDLDGVFGQVLAISSAALQEQVRQSLSQLDDYERRIAGVTAYARAVFRMDATASAISDRWNLHLARRALLSRAQRVAAVSQVLDDYLRLQAEVNTLNTPEDAAQVQQALSSALAEYTRATQAFLRFESTGDQAQAAAGNASLMQADTLINAANDRLTALLERLRVSPRDV